MQIQRKLVVALIGLSLFVSTPLVYAAGGGGAPHDEFGTTVESLQQQIDELEKSGKTDEETVKAKADLRKQITELEDGLFAPKKPIPSLFDDEVNGCTFTASGSGGSVSCAAGVLGSPCEVVMSGLDSSKNTTSLKTTDLTCTEFVDPLPARFMNGYGDRDSGTYCIQQTALAARLNPQQATGADDKNTFVFSNDYNADTYCVGLLHKTGNGDLTPILGFVMFVYNLAQPLLIIAGVIAIVIAGIFIMYAPGGEGDTIKKGKEMLIKIISGFLLFFMIKIFLSTINGGFFSSKEVPVTPSSSTTTEAGAAAVQRGADALTPAGGPTPGGAAPAGAAQ